MRVHFAPCYKKDFWRLLDCGVVPTNPIKFHLKYIQDVFALSKVREAASLLQGESSKSEGLIIGEIGANHSRVLPELHELTPHLHAIDVYDRSIGGGYTEKPVNVNYNFIDCLVGDSKSHIKDHMFDILFSVSVVENVPSVMFDNFFADHERILKHNGIAIHLVDFYCDENGELGLVKRIHKILNQYDDSLVYDSHEWRFRTSFCSNDDFTMYQWNKCAPALRQARETHQSCSFILTINID